MNENASKLATLVAPALLGSSFRDPKRWPFAVAVVRAEGVTLTSRGDHAHWLAANDLGAMAKECIARRVKPGHMLVWLDVEAPGIESATGFLVFDLATAVRCAARS